MIGQRLLQCKKYEVTIITVSMLYYIVFYKNEGKKVYITSQLTTTFLSLYVPQLTKIITFLVSTSKQLGSRSKMLGAMLLLVVRRLKGRHLRTSDHETSD